MATIRVHISDDNIPYCDTRMSPGDKVLVVHPGERNRVVGEYLAVPSRSCDGCIMNKIYECMGLVRCGTCCILSPEDTLEEL